MRLLRVLVSALALFALGGFVGMLVRPSADQGCRVFVEWQRNEHSLSPYPERVRGPVVETVRLLDCDGAVRVEREYREYKIAPVQQRR